MAVFFGLIDNCALEDRALGGLWNWVGCVVLRRNDGPIQFFMKAWF
jgi:hypothetical protein